MKKQELINTQLQFLCPYCRLLYTDVKDKYTNLVRNDKNRFPKISCICEKHFYLDWDVVHCSFTAYTDKTIMKNVKLIK